MTRGTPLYIRRVFMDLFGKVEQVEHVVDRGGVQKEITRQALELALSQGKKLVVEIILPSGENFKVFYKNNYQHSAQEAVDN